MLPEKQEVQSKQLPSKAVGMAEMAAWTVTQGSSAVLGPPSSGYWPSV